MSKRILIVVVTVVAVVATGMATETGTIVGEIYR